MCEYCDNIQRKELVNYTDNIEKAWIEIIDNEFILCLSSGIYVLRHKINFCPFCGKELILSTEPTTPEECKNIFQYLRLLDTFTERSGVEYDKWRYASDYACKNTQLDYRTIINHVETKFKKHERNKL